ncbi:MAG: fibronectin type III domain-containing protein, partial [Bacteroidales bacterium]|nr:fibronectin type III domain-containing protein [Bacteroidales bacterium]
MKKTLLFMLMAIVLSISGFSQEEILVGTGADMSTNFRSPSQTNFKYSYAQNIYHADEIGMGGTITAIAYKGSTSAMGQRTWRILMGNTSLDGFASDCVPVSDLTEVFVGQVSILGEDWTVITLENPFEYSGTSNLVIAVEDQTGEMNTYGYYESTTGLSENRSWRTVSDYTAYTAENPGTSPQVDTYFPNVQLTIISSNEDMCYTPVTISVEDIEETSATVSWTEREGAEGGSYTIQYKTANQSWDDEDIVELSVNSGTSVELSDLSSATNYSLRIRTECSESVSVWKSTTFSTACGVITSFPWTENFETIWQEGTNGQLAPNCWTAFDVNGDGDRWVRTTSSPISGSASATIYTDYNSANNDWLVSPLMELDGNKQVSFYVRNQSNTTSEQDEIAVYISDEDLELSAPSSTTDDLPGFTRLFQTVIPVGATQLYEVSLQGYEGNRHIAFVRKEAPADGYYLYLDDVTVSDIPECSRPMSLMANTTSSSATLSWVSTGENFTLYYKLSSASEYTVVEDVELDENGEYELDELSASSTYSWYVVANCDDETTPTSSVSTFTTPCGNITTLPWEENFDNVQTNTIPDCWNRINIYSGYPQVTTSYARSGRALEFQANYSGGVTQYAILPPFETSLNELQLTFWTRREGSSSGTFSVGYMTNPNDVNTFVALDTYLGSAMEDNNYHKVTLNYANIELEDGQTANIAFAYSSTSNWYWYVDDITVDVIPACVEPSALTTNNILSTSVELSWTGPEDVTEYTVYYKKSAENEFTAVDETISETPYTLTDLEPATTYQWKVSFICSEDDSEIMSEAKTFSTACEAITSLPRFWDFETGNDGGTSSYTLPNCWDRPDASYPYVYEGASYASSGTKSLYFYNRGNIACLPLVDVETYPINTLQLRFNVRGSTSNTIFEYGTMSNPTDANSFEVLGTITIPVGSGSDYQNDVVANYSNYEGENLYIALRFSNNSVATWTVVDDVTLEEIPACAIPSDLTANATSTSAELSWIGNVSSYEVYYKKTSETEYTQVEETITETSYTLEVLDPNTPYQWYVVAICDEGTNPQSSPITFTTDCGAWTEESLPATESFEIATETNPYVSCWTVLSSDNSSYPSRYTAYGHTGNAGMLLYSYNSGTTPNMIAMNTYQGNINELQVSFYGRGWGSSACTLEVGIMTDLSDMETFVSAGSFNVSDLASYSTYEEFTVSFADVEVESENDMYYVVFKTEETNSQGWLIDDITLEKIPACSKPINLSANTSTNSATLSWSSSGETFNVYYKKFSETNYTEVTGVSLDEDGNYLLDELEAGTRYDWYVVADCEGTNPTSVTSSFATQCVALTEETLPYQTSFEEYDNYVVPDCWTKIGNSTYCAAYTNANATTTGTHLFTFYQSNGVFAVLPPYNGDIRELSLDMFVSVYSNTYPSAKLQVGILTDLSNTEDFEVVQEYTSSSFAGSNYAYEEKIIDFAGITTPEPESGIYYVAMRYVESGSGTEFIIDDVTLDKTPSCSRPSNINATPEAHTATLTWTSTGENFTVYYKKSSETSYTEITEGFEGEDGVYTYILSGLDASSTYNWYVTVICEDNTETNSSLSTFKTACGARTLPYFEDFETYEGGYNILPNCWDTINKYGNYYPSVVTGSGSGVHSGTKRLQLTANTTSYTYTVLPPFDGDINDMYITFYSGVEYGPNYSGTLQVGILPNVDDTTTFIPVYTMTDNQYTSNYSIRETMDSVSFADVDFESDSPRIAFRQKAISQNYYYYLDDIRVGLLDGSETPDPIEPTVVTNVATGITQTTATLNGAITEVGNQTITARGFEWKATVGGTYTSVSATGTTMTANLTGLTANTSYTYRAFATTGNGTQYGEEVTFTTLEAGEEPCTPATATLNETVCYGETFTFNGNTYTTTGTYTTTVAGVNGECDTNYTINLTVNAQNTATETITVCYGETAEFNGQTLTEGTNTITVAGQGNDCDTLYTVTLVVRPENTNTVEVSINPDELPYQFGTQVLETEGTYTEVFTDVNGCDSTVTLNLTINSGINDVENG